MKRSRIKRKGRGTLHIVAFLLLGSALVRISVEAGPAIAQAAEFEQPEQVLQTSTTPDEGTFLAALQAREADLIAREARLDERLAAMQRADALMDEKLQKMIAAEEALRATIAMAESASQSDVAQLTTVYENMKPKEAAALFEEMSPEFAAGFLGMMRPDAAALIMTQLEPATAYSFSVVLAGRNANTPTE